MNIINLKNKLDNIQLLQLKIFYNVFITFL